MLATYAGDPEVTRYLSWPRHRSLEDTRLFFELSEASGKRAGRALPARRFEINSAGGRMDSRGKFVGIHACRGARIFFRVQWQRPEIGSAPPHAIPSGLKQNVSL